MCLITVYVLYVHTHIRYLFNQLQNKTNHYSLKLNTGNNHNNQEKKSVCVGLHYESPKCLGCSYTSLQQINQFCVYLQLCPVCFFFLQWNNQLPRFTVAPRFFYSFLKRHNFSVGRSARADNVSGCQRLSRQNVTDWHSWEERQGHDSPIHVNISPFFSMNSDFKF